MNLAQKRCWPLTVDGKTAPALTESAAKSLLAEVDGWQIAPGGKRLVRRWEVANFLDGLAFFQRVATIAEAEGHHPDLHLEEYKKVRIEMWSHEVGGLSENDFIVAAKIDLVAP